MAGKIAPGRIRTHTPSVKYRVLYFLGYRGALLIAARQLLAAAAACPAQMSAPAVVVRPHSPSGLGTRTAELLPAVAVAAVAAAAIAGLEVRRDLVFGCGGKETKKVGYEPTPSRLATSGVLYILSWRGAQPHSPSRAHDRRAAAGGLPLPPRAPAPPQR